MNSPFMHAPTFSKTIPSLMTEADSLCLEIRALLQPRDLDRICFPVELLTRECLANAVTHGNRSDPGKWIVLRLWAGREWIRLQVTDEGPGFAWRKIRQSKLDTAASSGRGLQLYTLYAERVRFNRSGNQITLWISKTNRTRKED